MIETGDRSMFIINVVSESRGVNDGEHNSNTIFFKLWMEGTLGKFLQKDLYYGSRTDRR